MRIEIRHTCTDADSYRAARVKSLFNCESGASFSLDADLPIEDRAWKIGLIVGPSGSGKSSLGRAIFGPDAVANLDAGWPADAPIIDALGDSFEEATAALAAVGLGSVPPWLRPFHALSTGERFRAGVARLVCAAPAHVVVASLGSAPWHSQRPGGARRGRPSSCPATPTSFHGSSPIGSSTQLRGSLPGGVFGDARRSISKSPKPTGVIGRSLSRIII